MDHHACFPCLTLNTLRITYVGCIVGLEGCALNFNMYRTPARILFPYL